MLIRRHQTGSSARKTQKPLFRPRPRGSGLLREIRDALRK